MNKIWRIGTRKSELALWQAREVSTALNRINAENELVKIESTGDQNLTQPLYEMGIQGVFTKELDIALLTGEIDIAVHSLKDVPTQLAKGIVLAAVLPRGTVHDILAYSDKYPAEEVATIASGSIRRRAQWLHKYPHHRFDNLRGNVQTRLRKLRESDWGGAIFAEVGLERLGLLPEKYSVLDWMIPAAAQGAVGVCIRVGEQELMHLLQELNCRKSWRSVQMERQFLRTLEGGCSAPIGAWAKPLQQGWQFRGGLFSPDGSQALTVDEFIAQDAWESEPRRIAENLLDQGGKKIMESLKH
ncbi:MAG: hydroxymethylbilane synthase [Flavobacteriaceae bacterium]